MNNIEKQPIAITPLDWSNLIGINYALRGMNPNSGLNCYGLVKEVYRYLNIELPARDEEAITKDLLVKEGKNWVKIDYPELYSVALLKKNNGTFGLGIVVEDKKLLQCVHNAGVILTKLSKYESHIVGYYKYKKDSGNEILPDGEGSEVGRTVGMLVVAVAAMMIPGGALGLTAGTFMFASATVGIAMAGMFLVNALFPYEPPSEANAFSNDMKDSRTYTWDGITNEGRQGLPKPETYGIIRTGGQVINERTWFDSNSDEWLDILITPCIGPVSDVSDIYINDTPIEDYTNYYIKRSHGSISSGSYYTLTDNEVEDDTGARAKFTEGLTLDMRFELKIGSTTYYCKVATEPEDTVLNFYAYSDSDYSISYTGTIGSSDCAYILQSFSYFVRYGEDEQSAISIFDKIYRQYNSGVLLQYDASLTTPGDHILKFDSKSDDFDDFMITLYASEGLGIINQNNPGNPSPYTVNAVIQYKLEDDDTWTNVKGQDYIYTDMSLPIRKRLNGIFLNLSDNGYQISDYGITTGISANFADIIGEDDEFELINNGTTYYCKQSGDQSFNFLRFKAYTDSDRTTKFLGSFTNGEYILQHEYVTYSTSGYTTKRTEPAGESYVIGFDTSEEYGHVVESISFNIVNLDHIEQYNLVTFEVYYRKHDATNWTRVSTYTVGSLFSWADTKLGWQVNITDLDPDKYQVRIDWVSDFSLIGGSGPTRTIECFQINNIKLGSMQEVNYIPVKGNDLEPFRAVAKTITVSDLEHGKYNFRAWVNTEKVDSVYYKESLYVRSYTEIIDEELAYPNNVLVGLRLKATDRLSGSRPTITSLITSKPLSIPSSDNRWDCSVVEDLGTIGETTIVKGYDVNGMRCIIINKLITDITEGCYWLVRLNSSGYAQEDRLLTKYFTRVFLKQTYTSNESKLYLRSTESFDEGEQIILFSSANAPIRNTAWATASMLLNNSKGRITSNQIDWTKFSEWNDWNEETVDGITRHYFDIVIDFQSDLLNIACQSASTARGLLTANANRYTIIIDKEDTPVQLFGDGNTTESTINYIPTKDRPNIMVVPFLDEEDDYKQKDISEDDVQSGEYPNIKSLSIYAGVTREEQVRNLLKFALAQSRYPTHTLSFRANTESIECDVGDCFYYQSTVKDFAFSGRIVDYDDNNIYIDRYFTPEENQTYRLTTWLKSGEITYWQGTLTGEYVNTIPLPTGFTMDGSYELNYILSKITEERLQYRVTQISRPAMELTSTINAIEYRSELYEND